MNWLELRTGDVIQIEAQEYGSTRIEKFLVCSIKRDVEMLSQIGLGRRLTYMTVIGVLNSGKIYQIYVYKDGTWSLTGGMSGMSWSPRSEIRTLMSARGGDQC